MKRKTTLKEQMEMGFRRKLRGLWCRLPNGHSVQI